MVISLEIPQSSVTDISLEMYLIQIYQELMS